MSDSAVTACLADVLADVERQGGIDTDDLNRLIDGHGLTGDESIRLLSELAAQGVQVEEIPDEVVADDATTHVADVVGQVLQTSRRFPLLTAEQEVALGRRIRIGQSVAGALEGTAPCAGSAAQIADGKAAHDTLVLSNTRLVVSIARRYRSDGMEFSDLIQEGAIGLMRAADKYDHTLGYKFSTYATWWIRQAITRGMADRGRLIRLPVHVTEKLNKVRGARTRLETRLGREPTLAELALELAMDPADVQGLLDSAQAPLSLDAPIVDTDTDLGEVLNLYSADVEEEVGRALEAAFIQQTLDELSDHVRLTSKGATARAIEMVKLRFGFEDDREWTLEEIGDRYGVTRERVRQILNKTLAAPMLVGALQPLYPDLKVER